MTYGDNGLSWAFFLTFKSILKNLCSLPFGRSRELEWCLRALSASSSRGKGRHSRALKIDYILIQLLCLMHSFCSCHCSARLHQNPNPNRKSWQSAGVAALRRAQLTGHTGGKAGWRGSATQKAHAYMGMLIPAALAPTSWHCRISLLLHVVRTLLSQVSNSAHTATTAGYHVATCHIISCTTSCDFCC